MVVVAPRWQPGTMHSTPSTSLSRALEDRAFYVESSIPPGLTLDEYRRGRAKRPTRWARLKRLAGGGAAAAPA
jgi:hypothetical protein